MLFLIVSVPPLLMTVLPSVPTPDSVAPLLMVVSTDDDEIAELARACADAGYVMSFAGNVTFPSAQPLRDAAAVAPAELILVETDAPFLTPVPNRGKPNTPAMSAYTLRFLAGLKQLDVAELCAAITATGDRVFGPW